MGSTLSPRLCPTGAHPNTSGSPRRWGPCFPTAGPGHCRQNSCRSAMCPRRRPHAGEPCGWALAWSDRRSSPPRRQPKRGQSRFPSTGVMCGRFAVIRPARSRSCWPRSATTMANRPCSPACPRRPIGNGNNCAVSCMGWERHPRRPTILSDGADGPRSLGEAASIGPTCHVLDWFHLAMRIQHAAQAA